MTLTQEMVGDILCTAFEGGITYWAESQEPSEWPDGAEWSHETLPRGATIKITLHEPHDEADTKSYTLTLPAFEQGIRRAAQHMGESIERFYENHDAVGADIAVQFALFDEIVYG